MMRISIRVSLAVAALALAGCPDNTGPTGGKSSGSAGTGGNGGAGPQAAGHRGADFVAAGNRSADSAHVAVSTLGQAPGTNGVSRSSKYQLIGGLVATTQP